MGWQVENYQIELDSVDESLIMVLYLNQVVWLKQIETTDSIESIEFYDYYFKLYTGGLHFDRSVYQFCSIIDSLKSSLLHSVFYHYLDQIRRESVEVNILSEKESIVARLELSYIEILEDVQLCNMTMLDFLLFFRQRCILSERKTEFEKDLSSFVRFFFHI